MRKKLILILFLLALNLITNIALGQSALDILVDKLYTLAGALYTIGITLGVIGIIVGAYLFLAAGGDTNKIEGGKRMILWSIIAVILMILSKPIIDFIQKNVK